MQSQENTIVQPKIYLPIYIKGDIDYFNFCKNIKPLTDAEGFNTKSSSSGLIDDILNKRTKTIYQIS